MKGAQTHPEGWKERRIREPTPINAKRLLGEAGIAQIALCNAIALPNGQRPSAATVGQILTRNIWPTRTPKHWLIQQIKAFLRKQGVVEEEIKTAFEIDENPNQARIAPPSTYRHQVRPSSPIANKVKLPESEMLTQAAKKHFRLFQDPFADDVQGADDVYLSVEHRYIRETMFYAAKQGRFIAVVGESGSGKSTLRRDLQDRIQSEVQPITIIQPRIIDKGRLSAGAICDAIIEDLGDQRPRSTLEGKARQIESLLIGSSRAGNNHVLLIEEAHDLTIATLKHLKRFWELEDGYRHLLGIILIGQPELQSKLDERINWDAREVIRRCEVAVLEPLDKELAEYLTLKFKRVDRQLQAVLADDALNAIRKKLTFRSRSSQQTLSMLYPLNINNLVRRAMNMAADLGETRVTAEIIKGV